MKISPEMSSNIKKVGVITLSYIVINWFLVIYNRALLTSFWSQGIAAEISFWHNIIAYSIIGLLAGTLGGTVIVYVNRKLFRKKSFRYAMTTTLLGYVVTFLIILIVIPPFMVVLLSGQFTGLKNEISLAYDNVFSKITLVTFLLWGFIVLFTSFILQVNDKFGPGILIKFILGKYHHPREEERIFMFMDMKSSTAIAEKIGSTNYFNMLQEVFTDITDAIISCEGEIYQYVGDEVVVSWQLKKGIKNENCIRCFNTVKQHLVKLASKYESTYGIVPEFKAGVHHGVVTAGEIGSIKKDIVFSGDVLNTASRIQEQCNAHQVDFLVSEQTLKLVSSEGKYTIKTLGEIELRGKKEKVNLITINWN